MKVDPILIANWSIDGVALLEAAGLSPKLATMQREIIKANAHKASIYGVAEDIAESISELPEKLRTIAQQTLLEAHGFGYEFFTDKKSSRVLAALRKGRIESDEQYELLLGVMSDTTANSSLQALVRALLVDFEQRHGRDNASE